MFGPDFRGSAKLEAFNRGIHKPHLRWGFYLAFTILIYAVSLSRTVSSSLVSSSLISFASKSSYSISYAELRIASSAIGLGILPVVSRCSDFSSRTAVLGASLVIYVLGLVLSAIQSQGTIFAGSFFTRVGYSVFKLLVDILIADLSPLKWRTLALAAAQVPYAINTNVHGYIVVEFMDEEKVSWGIGMFAIIIPVLAVPVLYVLHSLSSQNIEEASQKWGKERITHSQINWPGLLLLTGAIVLIQATLDLVSDSEGLMDSRSIPTLTIGLGCLIGFFVWEFKFASIPLLSKALINRTFLGVLFVELIMEISYYLRFTIFRIWERDPRASFKSTYDGWPTRVMYVGFPAAFLFAGIVARVIRGYKHILLAGIIIWIVGMGMTFHETSINDKLSTTEITAVRALLGIASGFYCVNEVAAQASVSHKDVATVIAIFSVVSTLGTSLGNTIAISTWYNHTVFDPVQRLHIAAIVIPFIVIPVIIFVLRTYHLGNEQNAVQPRDICGREIESKNVRKDTSQSVENLVSDWKLEEARGVDKV